LRFDKRKESCEKAISPLMTLLLFLVMESTDVLTTHNCDSKVYCG
jgi:hypothetical protein